VAAAFAHFDEPHAWLIRGLVEYGWADQTRTAVTPQSGAVGAIDLRTFSTSVGRGGVTAEIAAWADGEWCHEDSTYRFEIKVSRLQDGSLGFIVRCAEANYFQEFPFDGGNPDWAAGYIHQAITEYVPEFVRWRLGGGQLDWSTRAGIPEVDGESCSPALSAFVSERLGRAQRFDTGPEEGWWLGQPAKAARPVASAGMGATPPPGAQAAPPTANPVSAQKWSGAIAVAGTGGGDPVYLSADARNRASKGVAGVGAGGGQAAARTGAPGNAMLLIAALGGAQSLMWVFNGVTVLVKYRDSIGALFVSIFFAGILMIGALAAGAGAWQYRKAQGSFLPYVAMLYSMCVPVCCLAGVPVAIWAFMRWQDPMVKAARAG
jgi:hypothetical protein